MQLRLTALLLTILLCSPLSVVDAQEADMEHFASFEGLDRVIARAWMAPAPLPGPTSQGTPVIKGIGATPEATPQPESGIGMVSIFVYLFDSNEHAAMGWERIDDELQEITRRDPRAPMSEALPLDGVGDQARGYMGDLTLGNATITHTFATVQHGLFVYSISGTFSGPNGAEQTRGFARQLIDAPMERMTEQYNQNGGSRGGLWSKLNAVQPGMPEGSTVIDFVIYPMPGSTPQASS